MLQLGSTLGPYVVESLLAEGGMGAVYRARNRVTGQLRALKVVRPELAQKRDFVDRFVREATIASQLRHPNLVETLEPGIDGNVIYLPMELLEGETLAHHLKKKRRLTPAEAAELLVPVTQAVQALHDRGVVHRDLKPMNIFVTRAPNGALVPKVIDLGTARDVEDEEHTRTGMVVGSPFYMAPEQAEGRRDIDGRADQYALGVIAYQMITGARPYESDDTRSALAKLLRGEPFVPPSRHFPGLHAAVEAVIVKALERERERRFARIDELGAALTAAAAGLPVATASPPTMITEARGPLPVAASAPGAFVVPPVGPGPISVAPPPGAPGASPLGTPGPFAPPPEGTPAPTAARPRGAMVIGALVVLALLGVGTGAIVWTMSPTMTATPLAPRAPTLAGAGTEEPVMPPVTIPTTPVIGMPPTPTPVLDTAAGSGLPTPPTSGATTEGTPGVASTGAASGATTAPTVGTASGPTPGAAVAGSEPGPTGAGAREAPAGTGTGTSAPGTSGSRSSGSHSGSASTETGSSGSGSGASTETGSGSSGSRSGGASTATGSGSTGSGSSGRTGSGSTGSRSGGSRTEDDERGGGASHGAPCGAATGIPCLD